jgi:hypothetical protein
VALLNVGYSRRLLSIHSTGACQQKFPDAGGDCELQCTFRSANNRGERMQPDFSQSFGNGVGSGMDDVAEFTVREREAPHVTPMKYESGIRGKMRALCCKSRGIAGEHHHASAEVESLINVTKTLHQPASNKAGPSRQKDSLAPYFFPEQSGLLQNQFQILPWKRFRWAHQSSVGDISISAIVHSAVCPVRPPRRQLSFDPERQQRQLRRTNSRSFV